MRKWLPSLLALVPVPALATPGSLSTYVHDRAAQTDGDAHGAGLDYNAAPDKPLVAIRAHREGLEAGDLALADCATAVLANVSPADAPLQPLAVSAHTQDLAVARAALTELSRGTLAPLTPALSALVTRTEGRDPFPLLDLLGPYPVARRLAAETRALLFTESGRTGNGIAAVRATAAMPDAPMELRFDAAQGLAAQGRTKQARALLARDDPLLSRLNETLGDGARPSLGHDVFWLYTRLGVALASGGEPSPLVVALGRPALRAEPGNDRAQLLLADELTRRAEYSKAMALLDAVDEQGPFAPAARTPRVALLVAMGAAAAALALARRLAGRTDARPSDIQHYAELLLAAGRAYDAAAQYCRVDRSPKVCDAWLQYGGALDHSHRWPEARAALERAVALGPDEPLALNYLGYSRLKHREAVFASQALLKRAAPLKPDDTSITDSLGWAYFRGGQVSRALPMLKQAAESEPTNEVIAAHLDNAYWAAGRRFEARYAWRAAVLVAGSGETLRLAAKIARGPEAQ